MQKINEERKAYEDKADSVVLDIEHLGLYPRMWAINDFRSKYQDCPSALDYFEKQLEAYISREIASIDEMRESYLKKEDDYYLGKMFMALINLGEDAPLQELIDSGVNVEVKVGLTRPLHIAARIGNIPAMKALISAGANVNLKNSETNTPLYCCSDNAEATAFLLKNGANPSIFGIDGNPSWKLMDNGVKEAYIANHDSFS